MQHITLRSVFTKLQCNSQVFYFAASWLFGLLLGIYVSSASTIFPSLTYLAAGNRLQLTSLLVFFFPLVISAIAAFFSAPLLFFSICFFKAFCYGCNLFSIAVSFGNAAWLVHALLLFADSTGIVLFLWFCCRHLVGKRTVLKQDFAVCCLVLLFICMIDYILISPYLVMLIN